MKKIIFLVIALFVVNCAFSQIVKWGIKAGGNLSSLTNVVEQHIQWPMEKEHNWTETDGNGKFLGFHAGAFANISFGKFFGCQPELLFSLQGGKHKEDIGIPGGIWQHYVFKFSYVQLPLLLEIKPIVNFGILVGPQLGLNVSRSLTVTFFDDYWELHIATYPDTWLKKTETISGSDYDNQYFRLKKFDTSIVFGLQYTIKKLTIGARYNLGLANNYYFYEDGGTTIKGTVTKGLKSNVIQASLGYVF